MTVATVTAGQLSDWGWWSCRGRSLTWPWGGSHSDYP